jgi:hypothetical protein
MDAYRKGLDGCQAAWAVKKFKGHRVVPENVLEVYEIAHPPIVPNPLLPHVQLQQRIV